MILNLRAEQYTWKCCYVHGWTVFRKEPGREGGAINVPKDGAVAHGGAVNEPKDGHKKPQPGWVGVLVHAW